MKLKSDVLYPYPILWNEREDYVENNAFDISLSVHNVGSKIRFSINVTLENTELVNSYKDNLVDIVCLFECPKTKFREMYKIEIGANEIELPSQLLNCKVEVVAILRTIQKLDNYKNSKFHSRYSSLSFSIPSFSIIAVSSSYDVLIEKDLDELANISSIISIIPSERLKNATVDCLGKDKIYIKLPKKEYDNYFAISSNETFNSEIYAMFVIPALMESFVYLIEQDDLDLFSDCRWYRGIEKTIKKVCGKELTLDFLKETSLFELAQILLDNPISNAFKNMLSRGGN